MILRFLLGGAVGALAVRHWLGGAIERAASRRRPVGAGGIIPGGEPIEMVHDDAPAILMLHGCGDTPQTLRYLAEDLHARGYTVSVPLLPGHGRTLREFSATSADDWIDAARGELAVLRARHGDVAIVGLSMGGALATILAAETPELRALVLAAPYLSMPRYLERAIDAHRILGTMIPYLPGMGMASIRDLAERKTNLAYGYFAPRSLYELRQVVLQGAAVLPRITTPTLMLQSREDNRVTPAAAARTFELIGAPEKRMHWTSGNSHVITVDYGRAEVFEQIAAWLLPRIPPLHRRPQRAG